MSPHRVSRKLGEISANLAPNSRQSQANLRQISGKSHEISRDLIFFSKSLSTLTQPQALSSRPQRSQDDEMPRETVEPSRLIPLLLQQVVDSTTQPHTHNTSTTHGLRRISSRRARRLGGPAPEKSDPAAESKPAAAAESKPAAKDPASEKDANKY